MIQLLSLSSEVRRRFAVYLLLVSVCFGRGEQLHHRRGAPNDFRDFRVFVFAETPRYAVRRRERRTKRTYAYVRTVYVQPVRTGSSVKPNGEGTAGARIFDLQVGVDRTYVIR